MSLGLINLLVLPNLNSVSFIYKPENALTFPPPISSFHRARNSLFRAFSTQSNFSAHFTDPVKLSLRIRSRQANYERQTRHRCICVAGTTWKMPREERKTTHTEMINYEAEIGVPVFLCSRTMWMQIYSSYSYNSSNHFCVYICMHSTIHTLQFCITPKWIHYKYVFRLKHNPKPFESGSTSFRTIGSEKTIDENLWGDIFTRSALNQNIHTR